MAEQGNPQPQVREQLPQSNDEQSPPPSQTQRETPAESSKAKKRRKVKPRSTAWSQFTKIIDDEGRKKAKCDVCNKEFFADPNVNGTTNLKKHMETCKKEDLKQSLLTLQPAQNNEKVGTVSSWRFDPNAIREAIAYWIIIDELPLSSVEKEGFKRLMSIACPKFHVPSRGTITKECYNLYLKEKIKLKNQMNGEMVCLTTDTWTSLNKLNYMCIMAHYIDKNWVLNKKILNFCQVKSHDGKEMGMALEKCLLDWGVEKVFTITVDNASSNTVAIDYLRKRITSWRSGILNGKHLHMRCIAHINNLIVQDGLKEIGDSVSRVRAAVKFMKQSPKRLQKFKDCVAREKIASKALLRLDVPTRWNSTYMMLDIALKFKKVFDIYSELDDEYVMDLSRMEGNERGKGVPTELDWVNVEKYVGFLKYFYNLTMRVSGSNYVTSNTFFNEITELENLFKTWKESGDLDLSVMGERMKAKYDKYWGNIEKINLLIYISDILDPRHKLKFVEFVLPQLYGDEKGEMMTRKIRDELCLLFDEYKRIYTPKKSQSDTRSVNNVISSNNVTNPWEGIGSMAKMFMEHKSKTNGVESKSELEKYLSEDCEVDGKEFDILVWWKLNGTRFPILAEMARNIFAIPISTVPSESAFSTGGRVLNEFRCSLTPKLVEAFVCTQNWIRGAKIVGDEENLEALDKFEDVFSMMEKEYIA